MQHELRERTVQQAIRKAVGRRSECKNLFYTKSWSNHDFVTHFYLGRGRAVTLDEIGLLEEIKQAASELSIDRPGGFKDQIREKVRQVKEGQVALTFRRGYHFDHVRLAMGGAVLKGYFLGRCAMIEKNLSRFSGTITVEYSDIAEDALDLVEILFGSSGSEEAPNWLRDFSNMGGTPFNITGRWQESFSGQVRLR